MEAERAAKKYSQAKNAHKETLITHQHDPEAPVIHNTKIAEEFAKQALQEMEKSVVAKRIQLLNEMIARPALDIQPPVPATALPAPEISVQYTYTLSTEGATYQPQRDRAWRVPIVWLALNPLFSAETSDAEINDALRQIVPHLTRFATNDNSSSLLRTWMVAHLKTAAPFARRLDVESFEQLPHAATHHPACKPSQPPTHPLAIYSANCGQSGCIDIVVNTLGMEPHEEWHNTQINEYVGKMIRNAGSHMHGAHAYTKLTVVVSDSRKGVTHYLALHPFRSPEICQATHMITVDGGGISQIDPSSHVPLPKEVQTHHYCPTNKRLNELELNSVHSMALRYSDDTLDSFRLPESTERAKSARISSANHDILVTSYPVPGGEGETRTAISVFTYPIHGIPYKRDRPSTRLIQKICEKVMRTKRPPRGPKKTRPPHDGANRPAQPASGSSNVKRPPRKREDWEPMMPPEGKMMWFYWYSEDSHSRYRIFVIDHTKERKAMQACLEYNTECNRRMHKNFENVWHADKGFAENLLMNKNHGQNGMTPLQYYRYLWRMFIDTEIMPMTYDDLAAEEEEEELPWMLGSKEPYLYTSDPGVWKNVGAVSGPGIRETPGLYETYPEYMELRAKRDQEEYSMEAWQKYMELSSPNQQHEHEFLLADPYQPIAIPSGPRPATTDSPPALMAMIRSMQARLESMETERTRAIGNREHILLHRELTPS